MKLFQDWLLVKVIEKNEYTISEESMADTTQRGVVEARGDGNKFTGVGFVKVDMSPFKKGTRIVWIKHAETNTEPNLKRDGYALVEASKVILSYRNNKKGRTNG